MERYYTAKLFMTAHIPILGDTEMPNEELERRAHELAADFVSCLGSRDVSLDLVEMVDKN